MGITNIPTINADPNSGIKKIENNFETASTFWEYFGENETIVPPIKKSIQNNCKNPAGCHDNRTAYIFPLARHIAGPRDFSDLPGQRTPPYAIDSCRTGT
ncbi:hypothetical protein [Methanoregula sp.]|uniref:hypothetical protein n=1 Tax=Methanoregula sp. TaxID=2052170 RepID=UPI003BB18A8C